LTATHLDGEGVLLFASQKMSRPRSATILPPQRTLIAVSFKTNISKQKEICRKPLMLVSHSILLNNSPYVIMHYRERNEGRDRSGFSIIQTTIIISPASAADDKIRLQGSFTIFYFCTLVSPPSHTHNHHSFFSMYSSIILPSTRARQTSTLDVA